MRINDDLTRIIDAYPGRFVGFASIGFGNPQRSIAEVDRCINELGFVGVQVFSNIANRVLDSAEFLPILRHIATLGVPIHLHPHSGAPLNLVGMDAPSLVVSLGFVYDTSLNTLRLIQSGLFDQAPTLKLIVSHVGGVLPYLTGRIEAALAHPFDHYLTNLYVDSVCYHIQALECCYGVMGALYGTDHPFGSHRIAAELVERLACSPADRELIYYGNAERLFGLSDRTGT